MTRILICLMAGISSFADAQTIYTLPQMEGYRTFTTTDEHNFEISCGNSYIRVLDIVGFVRNSFTFTPGEEKVVISSAKYKKKLVLTIRNGLNDFNGIACIQEKLDSKILVWSNCGGSLCTDRFSSFYVIDPEKLIFIVPKNPYREQCDEVCAAKLVDKPLIKKIND